jgi:hypothetical protein
MSDRDREKERARIRAKLSEQDREFLDAVKQLFPNSRMVAIRFADGEHIGGKL